MKEIIPLLLIIFWGGKLLNYGIEMFYFVWLLYLDISIDPNLRNTILKGGFIRYIIVKSSYKAINLFLEYINVTYVINIKNYKNSTYDI